MLQHPFYYWRPQKRRTNMIDIRKTAGFLFIIFLLLTAFNCSKEREPIKLGFISVLSGVHAETGFRARNAVQYAVEQINESGGINGRPLELLVKDDQMNGERAVEVARELIEEEVVAIVAHTISSNTLKIAPLLEESGIIMIGDAGTALLTGLDDNYLRVCYGSDKTGELFAGLVMDKLNRKSAAVVYDLVNPNYTEVLYKDFKKAMESRGGSLSGVVTFDSESGFVADKVAEEIIETGADVCFIIASGNVHLGIIAQHLRKRGSKIQLITTTISPDLITAGGPAMEDTLSILGFDNSSTTERYINFKESYYERFTVEAGITDQQLYEAARIIIDALKQQKEGERLKDIIIRKSVYPGLDGNIIIDKFGDASRTMYILEIKNGKINTLDRIEPR